MAGYEFLHIEREGAVLRIWINRPDVRNAFNPEVIAELTECFSDLAVDGTVRTIMLGGMGRYFCAGADLGWMREMAGYTHEENLADARRLAEMLAAINGVPQRVVCRVQGGAFGGALGLLACCDTVISTDQCNFAFSEVRLGISPATIAPYVIAKIGPGHARDLFLSAHVFDALHAQRIGLVHRVVDESQLDDEVDHEINYGLGCGFRAVMHTKALINGLGGAVSDEVRDLTARLIADLRASEEGQEGLTAFLERRKPRWNPEA